MKFWLFLILALAVSGCATTTKDEQIQNFLSLTKEHFKSVATVMDDPLDTVATITTANGFQETHGLLGIVWDDNFLRSFVDKKTGKTSFQLYQVLRYQGSGWNFYQTVNFESPSGPQSKPVTVISRDVDCAGSRYSGCTYTEHVAFNADESLLQAIATNYLPEKRVVWKFKFMAQSGQVHNDGMSSAEITGLLEKVDEYRNSKGYGKIGGVISNTTNSTNVPLITKTSPNRMLGINMIPVPATFSSMNGIETGKGLMVVTVVPSSAAARVGILVGDIILKFDGREMNATAELQNAVKSAGDSATIELVRGREKSMLAVSFTDK